MAKQKADREDSYKTWSPKRIREELDLPRDEGDEEEEAKGPHPAPSPVATREGNQMEADDNFPLPLEARAKIEALENSLGHRLPGPYRKFLSIYEPERPPAPIFKLSPAKGQGRLERFYGVDSHLPQNYVLAASAIYNDRMPENLLPIAWDSYGNQICISLEGADKGIIYFWQHEDEYLDDSPPDYHNVSLLAESFDQFISELENRPQSEKDKLESNEIWNQRDEYKLQAIDRWNHSNWKHGPFKKDVWDFSKYTPAITRPNTQPIEEWLSEWR